MTHTADVGLALSEEGDSNCVDLVYFGRFNFIAAMKKGYKDRSGMMSDGVFWEKIRLRKAVSDLTLDDARSKCEPYRRVSSEIRQRGTGNNSPKLLTFCVVATGST